MFDWHLLPEEIQNHIPVYYKWIVQTFRLATGLVILPMRNFWY